MSSCGNSNLKQHIQDNSTLLANLEQLTQQLQTQTLSDFQAGMGIPIPDVTEAEVRQLEYTMVYSTDPIIQEYMTGAKTLLDGVFSQNWPDVADTALDVVQTLLNNVIGSDTIQTGASNQSIRIPAGNGHGDFVSAAFTEVEECSAKDWKTETNFYVAFYVFVVWEPSEANMAAIERSVPALA
jgi:hypothetical protein